MILVILLHPGITGVDMRRSLNCPMKRWNFMFSLFKKNALNKSPRVYVKHDDNTKKITLINEFTKEAIVLVDDHGNLVNFTKEDIDFVKVNQLENSFNAAKLVAPYGFYVDPFINGVALVSWTLYPDGRYFEDEDGFGGENCRETTIYGFIDTHGRVKIPFQNMSDDDIAALRHKAEQRMVIQKLIE
jgi:hypothetical protein